MKFIRSTGCPTYLDYEITPLTLEMTKKSSKKGSVKQKKEKKWGFKKGVAKPQLKEKKCLPCRQTGGNGSQRAEKNSKNQPTTSHKNHLTKKASPFPQKTRSGAWKKGEEEKGSGGRKGRREAGNGARRGYVDIFLEIVDLEAVIHSFFTE
jgi:hypothetical protein